MGGTLIQPALLGFPWRAAAAAVRGRSHEQSGQPCQDAVAVNDRGTTLYACVCDGAGSAPLSHFGAKAVSETLVSSFQGSEDLLTGGVDKKAVLEAALQAIDSVVPLHGGTSKDFACTLLFAAVSDDFLITIHLGDGMILCSTPTAGFVLSEPENGSSRNETYFVTSADAGRHLRVRMLQLHSSVSSLALMTDGAAEVLFERKAGKVSPVMEQMASWLDQSPSTEVSEGMRAAMADHFVRKTHDDCGLVLIRRSSQVVPWHCPVCRRLDLVREPLEKRQFLLRCPACGHCDLDPVPQGRRFPYLVKMWIRHLVLEEGMPMRDVQHLTRVSWPTLQRWLNADT